MVHGYVLKRILFLSILSFCLGCDPDKIIEIEEQVYFSDAIIVGVVDKIITGKDLVYPNEDKVYSVEMRVNCVYKNNTPVDRSIQVAGVGTLSSRCQPVDLKQNGKHILMLKKVNNYYVPLYREMDGSPSGVDEVVSVCDLKRTFPKEVNGENMDDECPKPYTGLDCFKFTPPSTAEPTTEPTPETPAEDPEVTVISVGGNRDPEPEKGSHADGAVVHFLSSTVLLLSIFVLTVLL